MDRSEIAAAITADLEAQDTPTPAPAPDPSPAATVASPEPEQAAPAPEPEPEQTPTPASLTDDTVILDPSNGQPTTWGKLKGGILRQADYTRKTMEIAEARRAHEAEVAKWKAEQEVLQAQAAAERAAANLPKLPEDSDDPVVQHLMALRQQQQALAVAQNAERAALEAERISAARSRLDAEEARAVEQHKLDEREKTIVGHDLLRRMSSGDATATYDSVAREYAEWRNAQREAIKEEAIREFKAKHRVGAPAAPAAAPAPGVATERPRIGTRAHSDAIREELAAMMR